MKRALVTGGTGFVGANLVRRLLRDGHQVYLLVRPEHATWRIAEVTDDVRLHTAELADAEAVRHAVGEARPDWIFHLAACGAYPHQKDPDAMVRTNVTGTLHLLRAAADAGFEALVHAGSSSEYGFKDDAPGEQEWLDPVSYYAVTKATATHLCRLAAHDRGAPVATLRLYSVYGPYEEPTRLIPTLVREGRQGRLPPLVDPRSAHDFVYVDDAVDAFVRVAEAPESWQPGAVFNVGSGTQTSLAEVVETCRRHFGLTVEPQWGTMASRTWDTSVWVADPRAIRERLGWQARTSFAEGFRRTAVWSESSPT